MTVALMVTRMTRETGRVEVPAASREMTAMDELIVLASDSHTLDGCDRVSLAGDQVIVQGKPVAGYPAGSQLRVPEGEGLTGISVEVFLDAADALRRRLGQA
jgi:hypothetical protein